MYLLFCTYPFHINFFVIIVLPATEKNKIISKYIWNRIFGTQYVRTKNRRKKDRHVVRINCRCHLFNMKGNYLFNDKKERQRLLSPSVNF